MGRNSLVHKRVVVTRPERQADSLCRQLTDAGAIPVRFPVIRLVPVCDQKPLRAALSSLDKYDWVVFTSVNGVYHALELMPVAWPSRVKVAAIGPVTCAALEGRGIKVHYMPSEFRAERIADGVDGGRILLLRAYGARPALREILRQRGVQVDEVSVYRAETNTPTPNVFETIRSGVDAITFTSASTVRSYAALTGKGAGEAIIACIGPITAEVAHDLGFTVDVVATVYTTEGLVDALERYYGR